MRQCDNFDDAMHYDCAECDEVCEFRKTNEGVRAFAWYVVTVLIILVVLGLLYL